MVHILIADDDAWTVRMIATVLQPRGYHVEIAFDGQDALERAIARPPALLITDAMMPRLDGWGLVKALRARPDLALVPVIFLSALSSEDDRIRGFRLGADDYVTKPFRFEELDLRVMGALRRSRQLVRDARHQLQGAGMQGDLRQIGVAALLSLIETERTTGRLTLRGADAETAELLVRDGRVVQATVEGRDGLPDAECVHHVLAWSAGDFELLTGRIEGPDRINTPTIHLLLEAARKVDAAGRDEAGAEAGAAAGDWGE